MTRLCANHGRRGSRMNFDVLAALCCLGPVSIVPGAWRLGEHPQGSLAAGGITRTPSPCTHKTQQQATARLRKNAAYFRTNYAMVLLGSVAAGFLMHPSSLFVLAALVVGWVYVFAVRTGPLVINGRELRCAAAI